MSQYACEVESLSAGYGQRMIVKDVTFSVPKGVIVGIVGPNGAGKSTLLKGMLGLTPFVSGNVKLFDRSLQNVRGLVAYTPQSLSLDLSFPVTVFDVVLMGTYPVLGWFKRPKQTHRKSATEALAKVGMLEYSKRQFGELSGGQRQRVLLARALVQKPKLLIMDEPFQGVDAMSERKILSVLNGVKESGVSILMVHHDLGTVPKFCDMVALLNRTLYAFGPTEKVFTPTNLEKVYGFPKGEASMEREEA